MELLLHLVDASYQSRNGESLEAASREINRIRYLVRLAKDLRVITLDNHEFGALAMDSWRQGASADVLMWRALYIFRQKNGRRS